MPPFHAWSPLASIASARSRGGFSTKRATWWTPGTIALPVATRWMRSPIASPTWIQP